MGMSQRYDRLCGSNGDPAKAARNLAKHGGSFDEASARFGELAEVFVPQAVAGEGCLAGLRT